MLNTTSTAITAPYPAARPTTDLLADLLSELGAEDGADDPRGSAVTRPMPAATADLDGLVAEAAQPPALPPAPRAGRGTLPPPIEEPSGPARTPVVADLASLPAPGLAPTAPATLEPVRFGEFLLERAVITEQQWLAALAAHWSDRKSTIGATLVEQGVLARVRVEAEAALFHDELDVVEIVDRLPRIQRDTERM